MSDRAHQRPESKAEPIDVKTIGSTPLLDDADLEDVLGETRLPLLPEVKRSEFLRLLNNILDRTNWEKLRVRLDQKTVKLMKASIETYTKESRRLIHSEFPAPLPPLDWLREVRAWVDRAESDLSARRSGGAPSNVDQSTFTPLALGLFHAGFGVLPDNSVSMHADEGRGAAFRFIRKVSDIARRRIRERGVAERVVRESLDGKILSNITSDEALRKRLEIALRYHLDTDEWTNQGSLDPNTLKLQPIVHRKTEVAWRYHSKLFRRELVSG